MFKCEVCKKVSEPREAQNVIVTSVRTKTYYDEIGKEIGQGSEIVREQKLCRKCKEKK